MAMTPGRRRGAIAGYGTPREEETASDHRCGGALMRDMPAKALLFVRRLVGDAVDHAFVQAKISQITCAQRAQFV